MGRSRKPVLVSRVSVSSTEVSTSRHDATERAANGDCLDSSDLHPHPSRSEGRSTPPRSVHRSPLVAFAESASPTRRSIHNATPGQSPLGWNPGRRRISGWHEPGSRNHRRSPAAPDPRHGPACILGPSLVIRCLHPLLRAIPSWRYDRNSYHSGICNLGSGNCLLNPDDLESNSRIPRPRPGTRTCRPSSLAGFAMARPGRPVARTQPRSGRLAVILPSDDVRSGRRHPASGRHAWRSGRRRRRGGGAAPWPRPRCRRGPRPGR